jgi:hypothetical protein
VGKRHERVARAVCEQMEEAMRRMGVITTAHYDAGHGLIVAALIGAEAAGAEAMRAACARAAEENEPLGGQGEVADAIRALPLDPLAAEVSRG